jgi:hypothetical protein
MTVRGTAAGRAPDTSLRRPAAASGQPGRPPGRSHPEPGSPKRRDTSMRRSAGLDRIRFQNPDREQGPALFGSPARELRSLSDAGAFPARDGNAPDCPESSRPRKPPGRLLGTRTDRGLSATTCRGRERGSCGNVRRPACCCGSGGIRRTAAAGMPGKVARSPSRLNGNREFCCAGDFRGRYRFRAGLRGNFPCQTPVPRQSPAVTVSSLAQWRGPVRKCTGERSGASVRMTPAAVIGPLTLKAAQALRRKRHKNFSPERADAALRGRKRDERRIPQGRFDCKNPLPFQREGERYEFSE